VFLPARIKIGVMGSAEEAASPEISETARTLALEIARRDLTLLTGATTGIIHLIGRLPEKPALFT
jgi:predicted Rossmann-fold nucleotide-binding protein